MARFFRLLARRPTAVASFGEAGAEVPLASPAMGEAILRAIRQRLQTG